MSTNLPGPLLRLRYERAAQAYLRNLPPEHFMEATAQGTQREITLESLALVKARRPDFHVFNELLVQYRLPRKRKMGQVVPDNMVVLCEERIKAEGSYDLPTQPVGPFWVLQYVSKHSVRKDYDDNFDKYERELKVPYFLLFYPDTQDLTLYHHTGRKYKTVPANEQDRHAIPEVELEVALLDGWVRFWYRGELLPLPADLQRDLDEARRQLAVANRRAEQEARRAEQEARRAEQEARRAEEERQARLAAEQELAQVRAQLEQVRRRPRNSS